MSKILIDEAVIRTLVLEALEDYEYGKETTAYLAKVERATAALRQALEQPAPAQEPVAWRELCRRLYVELFYCDQQMTSGPRPKWQQGKTVRDVLADAKTALETYPPATAQPLPLDKDGWWWVSEDECIWGDVVRKVEAAHCITKGGAA